MPFNEKDFDILFAIDIIIQDGLHYTHYKQEL